MNECEKLNFKHAWEMLETQDLSTELRRQCQNCNRVETLVTKQEEIKEWQEVTTLTSKQSN